MITINGVDNVDTQLDAGTTAWFTVGQKIVIDPGAADQQIVTVTKTDLTADTSTLTIDQPLAHTYEGGTMVSVAPGA